MRVRSPASVFAARTHNGFCSLAEAHASLNERSTQQQLLQRALLIQETVFGPDHEEVRLTLEELADAYGWCVCYQHLATLSFVTIPGVENIHAIFFSVGETAQQQKYKQRADAISAKQ